MKILGLNPSHHGSVCLVEDGELKFFIQEERIGNRKKYSPYPFRSFINILQSNKIDYITWGTPSIYYNASNFTTNPYWEQIACSYNPETLYHDFSSDTHHVCHVAHSFYNSGFKKCIGIVIDGLGSEIDDIGQETETVFECSYPHDFKVLHKTLTSNPDIPDSLYYDLSSRLAFKNTLTPNVTLSRVYETITMHLGWDRNEAGKIMGLAPYGKHNSNYPNFFKYNTGNPDVFITDTSRKTDLPSQNETFIDEEKNPQLKLSQDPREWHYNESKITNLEKDLAWKVQNDTQQLVGDYIEKAIQETGLKQVCCAGGYFLNCVTNYYLIKRFPDIEFYFEPIANDAGTSIGAAKLLWYGLTQNTTVHPFKSLYLGKQYSKEELLEGIKKYT
jgi:carbamoyltransferase